MPTSQGFPFCIVLKETLNVMVDLVKNNSAHDAMSVVSRFDYGNYLQCVSHVWSNMHVVVFIG